MFSALQKENVVSDRLAIGVDIGGTKIAFALVSTRGEVLAQHRLPTLPSEGVEGIFNHVSAGVHLLLRDAGQAVAGVGVGCSGHLNARTSFVYGAANLGWLNVPLRYAVASRLRPGLPQYVQKDADAAALGEM